MDECGPVPVAVVNESRKSKHLSRNLSKQVPALQVSTSDASIQQPKVPQVKISSILDSTKDSTKGRLAPSILSLPIPPVSGTLSPSQRLESLRNRVLQIQSIHHNRSALFQNPSPQKGFSLKLNVGTSNPSSSPVLTKTQQRLFSAAIQQQPPKSPQASEIQKSCTSQSPDAQESPVCSSPPPLLSSSGLRSSKYQLVPSRHLGPERFLLSPPVSPSQTEPQSPGSQRSLFNTLREQDAGPSARINTPIINQNVPPSIPLRPTVSTASTSLSGSSSSTSLSLHSDQSESSPNKRPANNARASVRNSRKSESHKYPPPRVLFPPQSPLAVHDTPVAQRARYPKY
eukprot:c7087_g1_i1.p1 GENE.c7087_g1_i1~~c7087_g1_i1.p1  ORF type:complete len:360 (+),score=50.68 c7087_g1_i1:53-1081(+)